MLTNNEISKQFKKSCVINGFEKSFKSAHRKFKKIYICLKKLLGKLNTLLLIFLLFVCFVCEKGFLYIALAILELVL